MLGTNWVCKIKSFLLFTCKVIEWGWEGQGVEMGQNFNWNIWKKGTNSRDLGTWKNIIKWGLEKQREGLKNQRFEHHKVISGLIQFDSLFTTKYKTS
jgi:hypothetical protein